MRNPFGYWYPAGAETDPNAPWNAKDNEECPQCGRPGKLGEADCTYEHWCCDDCGHEWFVQTGPDPDDARDALRDDRLTGDDW